MTENETLVKAIIEGAQEKKGRSITHVDLSGIETAATQGFVIVNGNTPIQVDAIADSIREYVETTAISLCMCSCPTTASVTTWRNSGPMPSSLPCPTWTEHQCKRHD